jgi:hypothetical protein
MARNKQTARLSTGGKGKAPGKEVWKCDLPEARPEKRQLSLFGGNSKYEEEEEEEEEKPNKMPRSEQNDATVVELANTADMGLCYCHICKYEVLCEPSDLPDDKTGPIKFIAQRDEEEETLCRSYDSSVSSEKKTPRGSTVLKRIFDMKGTSGLSAYKWAKERCSDHVVHTDMGSVPLFGEYSISSLSSMRNDGLGRAIDFFHFARDQYIAFLSGSTSREHGPKGEEASAT